MELPTVEYTNEELITGLRHIAHTMERNGHSYYQHIAENAIKALEQRWIPVSERLPEDAYGCLVTVYDTDLRTQDEFENILPYFVGYDGETWNNADGEPIPFEVIAWMSLPKPYEPQESEKDACKDCYYNDGEVHAECVICDKAESEDAE